MKDGRYIVRYKDDGTWTDFWPPNDTEVELKDGQWHSGRLKISDPRKAPFFYKIEGKNEK